MREAKHRREDGEMAERRRREARSGRELPAAGGSGPAEAAAGPDGGEGSGGWEEIRPAAGGSGQGEANAGPEGGPELEGGGGGDGTHGREGRSRAYESSPFVPFYLSPSVYVP